MGTCYNHVKIIGLSNELDPLHKLLEPQDKTSEIFDFARILPVEKHYQQCAWGTPEPARIVRSVKSACLEYTFFTTDTPPTRIFRHLAYRHQDCRFSCVSLIMDQGHLLTVNSFVNSDGEFIYEERIVPVGSPRANAVRNSMHRVSPGSGEAL